MFIMSILGLWTLEVLFPAEGPVLRGLRLQLRRRELIGRGQVRRGHQGTAREPEM